MSKYIKNVLLLTVFAIAAVLAVNGFFRERPFVDGGSAVRTGAESVLTVKEETANEEYFINGMLNINAALVEHLVTLPGIGEGIAEEIVKYRNLNGPFYNMDGLLKVKGIGEKKAAQLAPFIFFGARTIS